MFTAHEVERFQTECGLVFQRNGDGRPRADRNLPGDGGKLVGPDKSTAPGKPGPEE